jgi:hypothetical protein
MVSQFVYILSPSYSGSTLLTFLLAAHPEIATVGELKATSMGDIDEYRCSCGALIRQCEFWRRLAAELARRGQTLNLADFGTHFRLARRPLADRVLRARVRGRAFELVRRLSMRLLPGCARDFARILRRNRVLAEAIAEIQGAPVFLDGSKDPNRLLYLLESGFWPVKAIYMTRDGRGTTNSYMRHQDAPMETAALDWSRTQAECERVAARMPPDDVLRIRYEDLCADVDGIMEAVFRFIGLDAGPAGRDFRSCEHHVLGNAMRLRSSSEIKVDEKWRGALTAAQLEVFDRIAGRLNQRYGYV